MGILQSTLSLREAPTVAASRTAEPFDRIIADVTVWDTAHANSGLTIDFVAGDHVTLVAAGGLHHSGAVAHRLTTLIAAGVRHISIDLRQVSDVAPPIVACLTDIALHLSDSGGTLSFSNVRPAVAAAFASFSFGEQFHDPSDHHHVPAEQSRARPRQRSGGGTNR